jgi:energy-converting hydrogenase B subunit D
MIFLQLGILLLVVISGTMVVFTRDVASQPIVVSFFGIILGLMFFVFQAPDVALSQIVVGAVGLPLMVLLTLAKLRRDEQLMKAQQRAGKGNHA